MKKTKQTTAVILSIVFVLSAIFGQLPASTRATAASYDINNPVIAGDEGTTWDCIWFGNYWQYDTNGDGKADKNDAKQPIKWRVLSVDGDDAFLLADQNLDCQAYNIAWKGVTWETSLLRTWLNDTFYLDAFSSAEQSAIQTTTVVNEDNPKAGTEGGNDTQDKVYVLSIAEVCNEAYGFDTNYDKSDTRVATNTAYLRTVDLRMLSAGKADGWWLRSPGSLSNFAASVHRSGMLFIDGGLETNTEYHAVRPVLHINLSSDTWSKAGTVSSSGDSTGGATESPASTQSPSPTQSQSPAPTQTPDETKTPAPTQKPDTTIQTPVPTGNPNNQDTAHKPEPTVTPVSENTELKDSTGTAYTVTKSDSSKGEVAYTAPQNKKLTSVTIPATVELSGITYKVTSVKANAFKNCKKLKKVTIGKDIKTIGKNAFYGCAKLNSVTIKTTKLTNKSVGSKAFAGIHKKAKFKVPKKKLSAYKKLLKKKGVTGKKQVIKK